MSETQKYRRGYAEGEAWAEEAETVEDILKRYRRAKELLEQDDSEGPGYFGGYAEALRQEGTLRLHQEGA